MAEPRTDPSSSRPAAHRVRRVATIPGVTGASIARIPAGSASVLLALTAATQTQSRSRPLDRPTSP
jgi:hypothetical protein